MNKLCLIVTSGAMLASLACLSQKKEFTNEELLTNRAVGITQPLPTVLKWLDDENFVINKRQPGDATGQNFIHNIKTGKEILATPEQSKASVPSTNKTVFLKENDLFYRLDGQELRLTNDKDEEKNATISPDGNYVAYTKNNNLYSYNLTANKEIKLTTDGSFTTLNGYASWVYYEEIFGRPTKYRAFWWSPTSRTLAYMHFDESMVPMFPIYNSEGQHGFLEQTRYPEAGDKNPEVKVGFVSPDGGVTTWADFNEKDDHYFGWPIWKPDGTTMLVQWINRDQNDLKIYDVNPATGGKKVFYAEHQDSWVDLGDGAGGRITFLYNKTGFILKSDRSGWAQLYLYNMDGTLKNAITTGNFTVSDVKMIDEKNGMIYFTARKENSARHDFYSVKMNGKDLKRLTFGDYSHRDINLSPSAKYFISTYSNVATPTQMALLDTKGKLLEKLGNTKGPEMDTYDIAKTEYIHIKSDDGLYELPAIVTWPINMDSTKRYPMLISIYGGPNAGTVYDVWSWTPNRQWYAKEGMIQVAFDHRASGHFGKAGVSLMHRQLGKWELIDYKTMAKWFIKNGHADSTKICMTGFSYGGYMTCLALTAGSDVFTHGMAGGSVTDWALYDSHYVEKFMDLPKDNVEGYKNTAPLSFVNNYKGMLQIVHGTMDDNVHMQNSLQLISLLQNQKKEFEFMLYPGGRHGWRNLPAKNDHFDNLKTKFIYRYLLEKEVPAGLLK